MLKKLREQWAYHFKTWFDADHPQPVGESRAQQAANRARRHAFWQRSYGTINELFNFNIPEFLSFLRTASKWLVLGTIVGILAGTASAIFLISLAWATEIRIANPQLLFLLPVAGFIAGWFYWRFGGTASKGNNLVIDEVNNNQSRIPLRMAPFVLIGTIMTHFFGGSAGREGTAIQMGASLADSLQRLLRLNSVDRRLMIMAGIAGGFGSVFGVPAAGFIFGMEVQNVGRIRYEGIIPCMVASFVGDFVTRALGAHHSHYPAMAEMGVDPALMLKVAIAGIAFGLTSMLFIELVHGIKHLLQRITKLPPLYPVIGGFAIIVMTLLVGTTDYNGLSLPLISNSVSGAGVVTFAFLLKLLFTTVTLGSGYYGGEVTPLLVIGSTLGFTMGRLLGVDPAFMASIGLVAVFAGASNTPLASAVMGIELVGGGAPLYLFLGCVVAYLASGHRGIYATQQVAFPKSFGFDVQQGDNLQAIAARQHGWLPPLPGISSEFGSRLVRSIMSRQPVTVRETTPLPEIVAIAVREGVRSMPVLNPEKALVGIITDEDLYRAGVKANFTLLQQMTMAERLREVESYEAVTAGMIMTPDPITVLHTDVIAVAVDMINRHRLKRLPVVDKGGHLMGIITRSDILREIVVLDLPEAVDAGSELNWQATLEDVELEPAYTVTKDASVAEAIQVMLENDIRRVIVMHDHEVVGIVTESDMIHRMVNEERDKLMNVLQGGTLLGDVTFSQTVSEVMTTPVIVLNNSTLAYLALRSLMENQIKRIPVLGNHGEVQGLVGRAGIMDVLSHFGNAERS
ncbi:chloride channel protein [Phototrophicus methaneseepsis]|uniref:Chloride channel protein n=1 Tax=Phototrophicus methaneseepsis TaxID=2710758 RepID=A0A7S8E8F6_9CHLR|nr:chloride channel protein [Phototrophicus methaneseepsis]QPC82247.1 chloride channel protein [Phototrophicus methaneseepsis]